MLLSSRVCTFTKDKVVVEDDSDETEDTTEEQKRVHRYGTRGSSKRVRVTYGIQGASDLGELTKLQTHA